LNWLNTVISTRATTIQTATLLKLFKITPYVGPPQFGVLAAAGVVH
jgi:hypothetical protein